MHNTLHKYAFLLLLVLVALSACAPKSGTDDSSVKIKAKGQWDIGVEAR